MSSDSAEELERAAREWDAAHGAVAAAEADLVRRRAEATAAAVRLAALLTEDPPAALLEDPPATGSADPVLGDESLPVVWRIAIMLLREPALDYVGTAERIWGPLEKPLARQRVNMHVMKLRRHKVLRLLGGCRYEVDPRRLAFGLGRRRPPAFDTEFERWAESAESAGEAR